MIMRQIHSKMSTDNIINHVSRVTLHRHLSNNYHFYLLFTIVILLFLLILYDFSKSGTNLITFVIEEK